MKDNFNSEYERKHFWYSWVFPVFYLLVIWAIKFVEIIEDISFYKWGVRPLSLEGIPGIFFSPLIHKDIDHIVGNSISFIVLAWGLFYFYSQIAPKVFLLIYFFSSTWLWFGARDAYHIGASGLVYGMASFLFFSGIIRRYYPLIAISLFVVFEYGGMIWGIFPFKFNLEYSWEAHMWGTIAGMVASFAYRKEGPQRKAKIWEEEEGDLEDENPYWQQTDIKDP